MTKKPISNQTTAQDFEVGMKVVFIDDYMPDDVMTISSLNTDAVFMDDDTKFSIKELIRVATVDEIQSNCRGAMAI
ncbi:hypothetical protein C5B41_13795 [Acinetobacter ursingii]|uniref:hypothetical protein n=1 Tax=Acinetobacter ursingii TaxID=108980 RepID=UPI000CF2E09A|nr:hypothetical protein [Acinetobacter ursingii]PPZ93787.1 hypothetical protein C5B41_13795 [Acinetobacter ursingii]